MTGEMKTDYRKSIMIEPSWNLSDYQQKFQSSGV